MPTQSDYRFDFEITEGPSFEVVRFGLSEGLSTPFRLELELASGQSSMDFDALLDVAATFTLSRSGVAVRRVHGIVTAFEQGASGFRRTRYRAVVEPELVRLGLRHNSRIFQRQAVPAILKTLLDEQRVQGRFETAQEHLEREYCVQHREYDQTFLQRLAGEEGLAYYFDAAAQSQLVLTDALPAGPRLPGAGEDTGTVIYQPNPGGDAAGPRLWRFAYRRQLAPTRATGRDYTFRNPRYDLQHQAQASGEGVVGDYEHYDAPGRYKVDEAGKPFTRTRLQALRHDAGQAEMEGDDARLWPGLAFALADAPGAAPNHDWRVVAMLHQGEQSSSQEEDGFGAERGSRYAYTAQAVPASFDWKPAPSPRPVMDGPQMAHVVGPPGEEIHVDEHGRVMVWFPWDREGPRENSTCWIRVSQGWAGASYGMQVLPRIGHEVLVSFLEGDPDQPIVTGRAYHAANRPPYA
ncbi:type VI secretion system Vgr family protein, partial [Pseudoxanthomonas putridarboris]